MIDTGGRWFPIFNTSGESVLYKNIQVGNGYRRIFYPKCINPNAIIQNVEFFGGLYVSSVWKDECGHTHFLCSNNNMQTCKTVRVVTDLGEYCFQVDRHPTPVELSDDPKYKSYRFKDLPYDIEFVIKEDIAWAEFYDGSTQIRSVNFKD